MSGTAEAVLGGRGSQPAGGSPVLCFGQVSVSSSLEGMRLSENQDGLGKQCVWRHQIHGSCYFHLETLFERLC